MARKKVKIPKERNEIVFALAKRAGAGAGAHEKTKKAKRRAEKVALKKGDYSDKQ